MRWTWSTRSPSTDRRRRRLLAALPAAVLAACGRKAQRYPVVAAGSSVLALGDSLTHGTGAPADAAYPAQLAALTGWSVVNAGIPGDTSARARQRLAALLAEHQPKLVLLSIGGNDFLRQVPEADTRANVAAMIDEIRAAGVQVVLVSVPRPAMLAALFGALSDHPLYAELAAAQGVPLFADGWSAVLSDDALRSDKIHANAAGYRRFARDLHRGLREMGIAPQ